MNYSRSFFPGRSALSHLAATGAVLAVSLSASIASASIIVDRGLPDQNLNNAAGGDRSNVAWGFNPAVYSVGDDFIVGNSNYTLDALTVWIVAGSPDPADGFALGDRFDTLSLFLGTAGGNGSINRVATTGLSGNAPANTDVTVNQVWYPGTSESYQGSGGGFIGIWEVTFNNLGIYAGANTQFNFAVDGDDSTADEKPTTFLHASNAALSGTPQDGADNLFNYYFGTAGDSSINFGGQLDSDQAGFWDKSSDINVRVSATDIPAPATLLLMGLGALAGRIGMQRAKR